MQGRLVGVGVLRYKHLNLSTVLKITPSTVHCFCTKGKQAKLRQGFYWCVPATFSNRFAWAKPWVDQFQLLSPARRKHCGLEEPSLLTSYSWRRLGTTVGLLANFSVPQLRHSGQNACALCRLEVRFEPLLQALRLLCGFACSGLHCLGGYPTACCGRACRLAKDEAALAVEQDCAVVWSSPARSSLEPPRLKLTAAAREWVRKHSNSQVVMPEVIGNKRVGPALRLWSAVARRCSG